MRPIDADALREEWLYENGTFEPNDVFDSIDCQPTVDAVPVVRCRERIHRDPEDHRCDCGGHEWLKGSVLPMPDDFYCADGERKEGAE